MNSHLQLAFACLLPLFMTAGCLSMGAGIIGAPPRAELDDYTLHELSASSLAGCEFDYRIYHPTRASTATSIIIGHGFLRDQDNMVGLSRALANRGIPAITLNFCNMRPWNGHHERNAQDMRHLATLLGREHDVVYAGFSAGALAAVLAADNDTRAIMALDLVDQNNLGLDAIKKLSVPLLGLSGPPSACNANNQSDAVYSTRNKQRMETPGIVPGASHCEFESPSNWLCEVACGDDDGKQTDMMQRSNIIEMSIDAMLPFLSPPVATQQPTALNREQ